MGRVRSVSAGRRAVTLVIEEADSGPNASGAPVTRQSRRTASADHRNLAPSVLIEHAIRRGEGRLADSGALVVETGVHTGRSPEDKFVVRHGELADEIWWGSVNQPMSPDAFARLPCRCRRLPGRQRPLPHGPLRWRGPGVQSAGPSRYRERLVGLVRPQPLSPWARRRRAAGERLDRSSRAPTPG